MLTRRELFDILRQKSGENRNIQTEHLFGYLVRHFQLEENTNEQRRLQKECTRFCSKLFAKFEDCSRTIDRFLVKNDNWLNGAFVFEKTDVIEEEPQPSTSSGRPKQLFSEIGDRAKRKRAAKLSSAFEAEELTYAAKKSLKEQGQHSASKLISEALFTTPTRAEKIRSTWLQRKRLKNVAPFSEDEAVSLMIEAKLSKHQYSLIRREAKKKNADIYPSYHKVLEAKGRCYPPKEAIVITESLAEVTLQELLNHTASRLVDLQTPVLLSLMEEQVRNLILLTKWGCDGSTGHSQYKQRYAEAGLGDGDLFLTSLVPLQLYYQQPDKDKIIVWQNPRPSSTRFCRPIRFQFQKETTQLSLAEMRHVEEQIEKLQPTTYKLQDHDISIKHVCIMSMIDGKVCNALTDTKSAQICYVCKATPVEMNNIDKILQAQVDEQSFRFGLSTLHAWIRCFECLLHVSYRLGFKKWQVRAENKPIFNERKKQLQEEFRNKMGLLVDFPKIGGSGTSNDGNTARRFFKDPAQSASITGIDEEIIRRFGVLLSTLSCGYEVNYEAFDEYAVQTARLFVEKYPWYYMPASVHKILLHGSAIIKSALLPIGQLSEEAQESRNKDLKKFRELHTRKTSRISANEDLLNRLLVSSDPLVSSLRELPKKKLTTFSPEVVGLLKKPEIEMKEPLPATMMEGGESATETPTVSADNSSTDEESDNESE